MTRDGDGVEGNTRHVAPDILAAVVDTRVEQCKEGRLQELARTNRHGIDVLRSDTEFNRVERRDILQEATGLRHELTKATALDTTEDGR